MNTAIRVDTNVTGIVEYMCAMHIATIVYAAAAAAAAVA